MKLLTYAVLLACTIGCNSSSNFFYFPPDGQMCTDPSGRFTIRWQQATEKTSHVLYFTSDTAKEIPLYGFDRSVDVLWSPSGDCVSITDWGGSNFSEVIVVESKNPKKQINISDFLPNDVTKESRKNHHLYLEAKKWTSDKCLLLRLWGYGWKADGTGEYEQWLKFDLQKMTVAKE